MSSSKALSRELACGRIREKSTSGSCSCRVLFVVALHRRACVLQVDGLFQGFDMRRVAHRSAATTPAVCGRPRPLLRRPSRYRTSTRIRRRNRLGCRASGSQSASGENQTYSVISGRRFHPSRGSGSPASPTNFRSGTLEVSSRDAGRGTRNGHRNRGITVPRLAALRGAGVSRARVIR